MSVEQDIMVKGHIDRRLLTEYAAHPDDVDDDTVEEIWRHLDSCDICTEDFDAIREGQPPKEREPEEAAVREPAGSYALEPDVVHPDDLAEANVFKREDNAEHLNGHMPEGDTQDRNGKSSKSEGDKPSKIKTQSIIEAAIGKSEEDAANSEGENKKSRKEPAIEGLISCEVRPLKQPVEQMETESAVQAGERLAHESTEETNEPEEEAKEPESAEKAEAEGEGAEDTKAAKEPDDDPFIYPVVPSPGQRAQSSDSPGEAKDSQEKPAPDVATQPQAVDSNEEAKSAPPVTSPKPRRPEKPSQSSAPKKPAKPAKSTKSVQATNPPKAKSSQTVKSSQTTEPLEELLNKAMSFLRRPRNAIILGSVVVVVAAAIVVASRTTEHKEPSPVAGWAPLNVIESNVPLQELLIRKMRRGKIRPANGVDVTLNFRGIRKLVIAVDLDFVGTKASLHEVIVRNPEGKSVYQEAIPQVYLDDGRAFLRLIPKLFEEGQTYTLEVVAHHNDGTPKVLAESAFDVLK
jgi:hypothetical protein